MPSEESASDRLRSLPAVHEVLAADELRPALAEHPRALVADTVRQALDEMRVAIRAGKAVDGSPGRVAQNALRLLSARLRERTARAINATGVVVHTGLGRAVLAPHVLEAIQRELCGYCRLQIDLDTGRRGKRGTYVERLLCEITGAEAAFVVNNNAAATLLVLSAFARGREVIISRGQLIEIGGSFRIPEVLSQSGARLVEVGTTNKTHLYDYERAISENTAMIMRVHMSNYRIVGFTESVPLADLVALARRHGLLVVDDLGSGLLLDLAPFGLRDEPVAQESIRTGADIVTFSGDKLLGGPQAGIILGRREAIAELRRHPLARALRICKMTYVALEATLELFLEPEKLFQRLPTLRMLCEDVGEVRRRARRLARRIRQAAPEAEVELVAETSQFGSGALPAQDIPTCAVALGLPGVGAQELAARLRRYRPPVVARIKEGRVLLDARTILPGEEAIVAQAIAWAASPEAGQ